MESIKGSYLELVLFGSFVNMLLCNSCDKIEHAEEIWLTGDLLDQVVMLSI